MCERDSCIYLSESYQSKMARRYIDERGTLSRKVMMNPSSYYMGRLLCIVFVLFVLVVTNPANIGKYQSSQLMDSFRYTTKKWFQYDPTNMKRQQFTNYVFFALSNNSRGVNIAFLMNDIQVCDYFGRTPTICDWISDRACHGIELSWNNLPFMAVRILQSLKIISFILQNSYKYGTLIQTARITAPLASMVSVFYQPFWHNDLFTISLLGYQMFELLDRIVTAGTSTHQQANLHFYFWAFCITVIVGGIANAVGHFVTKESVRGMKGSIAAYLGYICAAKPHKVLLDWFDFKLTSGDILFGVFATTFLSNMFGLDIVRGWHMGDVVSYACGGMIGYFLFNLSVKEYYNLWWWTY